MLVATRWPCLTWKCAAATARACNGHAGIVLVLAVIHKVDALEGLGFLAFARLVLAVELDLYVDTAKSRVGVESSPYLLSIQSRPAAIDDLFEQG